MKESPRFGAQEWKKYFDFDVGDISVPESLSASLNEPCPYWKNLKIKDTHLLVLIPGGLTSNEFWKKCANRTLLLPIDDFKVADHSYWILITKKTLPGSRSENFEHLKDKLMLNGYSVPTFFEASVATLALLKSSNLEIYCPPTGYTKTQESIDGYPVSVGSEGGANLLGIMTNDWNSRSGVAAVRKE